MSNTLTIRLDKELMDWLRETSRATGIPMGRLVREQLENAKVNSGSQKVLHLAGAVEGLPDLSSRKGFARR